MNKDFAVSVNLVGTILIYASLLAAGVFVGGLLGFVGSLLINSMVKSDSYSKIGITIMCVLIGGHGGVLFWYAHIFYKIYKRNDS